MSPKSETEARPDTCIRCTYPNLLRENRSALARLLGADVDEMVLVPNATTGVSTVLRNVSFLPGDIILFFSSIYGACENTIRSLSETCPISSHKIDILYPVEDDDDIRRFCSAVEKVNVSGKMTEARHV